MVPQPREHRIFHYTSCLNYLRDILTHGFWPRFCVEEFDWLLGDATHIAFPIVCFCDIPIAAAGDHRIRYGRYALAVSKVWAITHDVNPVWYVQVGTSIRTHLEKLLFQESPATLDAIPPTLKPLLPFLKKTVGAQPDRGPVSRPGYLEVVDFEQELEWRHTPSSLRDTWKIGSTRHIVNDADHELSRNQRLELKHTAIEVVYVQTEDEKVSLVKDFPTLEGKVKRWRKTT